MIDLPWVEISALSGLQCLDTAGAATGNACSLQELRQLLRKVITKKPQGNQLTEVQKQFSVTLWIDSQEPRV